MIGKTISHYKVTDKLGEGGMGAVYVAEDTTLNRQVALKTLSQHLTENDEARERFVREAQAASAINHPNITTVFELLEEDDTHFICMEYVDGKTFREMVAGSRIPVKQTIDIILQAAEGLEAAHDEGILHRDIKSANIMVNEKGRVKVMDFGLAHLEDRSQLTRTGTTMGTLAYSSPEQVSGRPVTESSEIFSLGVVFYELLTGQLPFEGSSEAETVLAIISGEPTAVAQFRGDASDQLEAVVTRMLDKDTTLRYQNCGELIGDLKAIQGDLETTTIQLSASRKAAIAKRKVLSLGIASAVIVTGAIGALMLGSGGAQLDPNRIVVDVIENRTGDDSLNMLGSQAAAWIARGISESQLIGAVPFDQVESELLAIEEDGTSEERINPLRVVAETFHAGTAITGEIFKVDETTIEFQLNLQDIKSGEYRRQINTVEGDISDGQDMIEQLWTTVSGALALEFDSELSTSAYLYNHPPSPEAYQEMKAGILDSYQRPGYLEAVQHFYNAYRIDSSYLTPLVNAVHINTLISSQASLAARDSLIAVLSPVMDQLTQYERLRVEYAETRQSDGSIDWSRAYEIAVEGARLAPGTTWSFEAGQIARIYGHPQEALDYFAEYYSDNRRGRRMVGGGNVGGGWYNQVFFALQMAGKHRKALNFAREMRGQRQDDWRAISFEARALAGLGKLKQILDLFEESKSFLINTAYCPGSMLHVAATRLRGYGYRDKAMIAETAALDWFETAPDIDRSQWRSTIAIIYYYLERWEDAEDLYSEIYRETGASLNMGDIVKCCVLSPIRRRSSSA